jgi:hypothetical protein
MGIFFDIIQFGISSVFWGLLLAAAMMALFVFIVRGWWKDALFTVWTYITGAILAVILFFQCTLMIGALKMRSSCDEYEAQLKSVINTYYTGNEIVNKETTAQLFGEVMNQNPLIRNYLGAIFGGSIEGSGYIFVDGECYARDVPNILIPYFKGLLNSFILRRILWSLGFVLVLGFIAVKTMETSTNNRLKARSNERIARRGTERISRDTKRISRHR